MRSHFEQAAVFRYLINLRHVKQISGMPDLAAAMKDLAIDGGLLRKYHNSKRGAVQAFSLDGSHTDYEEYRMRVQSWYAVLSISGESLEQLGSIQSLGTIIGATLDGMREECLFKRVSRELSQSFEVPVSLFSNRRADPFLVRFEGVSAVDYELDVPVV